MAIEPVKIPQNVYVEDRIFGPITLRQLLLTGLGAGLSYALYAALTRAGVSNIVFLAAAWLPALAAAMFSFLKINDLTLFNIILLLIEGIHKPNKRMWDPDAGLSINIVTKGSKKSTSRSERQAVSPHDDHIMQMTAELEEREKKLRQLTAESDIAPLPNANEEQSEPGSLPVNKNRVRTDALDAVNSVDGVMTKENMHHLSIHPRP